MIYDLCDCNLSAALSASVFFGLAVAEAGEVRVPPRAHSRVLGYLSVGQSVVSVFTELAARVPRKVLVFEGIVINFAKKKEKKPHQPHPSLTPNPSPSGEGSD